MVLPRAGRGLPLAPAQQARRRREGVGDDPPRATRLHRRQRLLVVRHGHDDRLHGHAAADLLRRRQEGARLLHPPARAPRRARRRARRVPAVHLLGPDRRDRLQRVDHRRHPPADAAQRPHPLLRPAPRLRPPALRPRLRRGRAGRPGDRRRAGAAPRRRRAHRRHHAGALGVRHHRRRPARRHQPDAAPQRAARGLHPGRHGVPRPVDLTCLRRRRPPGRARLRRRPRRPRDGPRAVRRAPRRRPGARPQRAGGVRPRPRALRRPGARRRRDRLVHLLLLARRRPGARLRPGRRDPPQAGLRPRRAVLRPRGQGGQAQGRAHPRQEDGGAAVRDEGRAARPVAGARHPRTAAEGPDARPHARVQHPRRGRRVGGRDRRARPDAEARRHVLTSRNSDPGVKAGMRAEPESGHAPGPRQLRRRT